MGLLSGMLGNAAEVDVKELEEELSFLLIKNETLERAFKLIRDMFVFTNKRLIVIDKQGITGRKVDYHSVPYKNIAQFSIETQGNFDLDSELKIWIKGTPSPIIKQFKKGSPLHDVQIALAAYVLKHSSE